MTSIEELHQNKPLWYKLDVSIYDLQKFSSDSSSQDRLNSTTDTLYLSEPYFDTEEAQMIRRFKSTSTGKPMEALLQKKLEANVQQKKTVCTSHHLLRVFEQVFGVSAVRLSKDVGFKKLVKRYGLEAMEKGVVWGGC